MTDNEIIKALECCTKGLECKNCPANPHKGNYGYCTGLLLKDALDLINRLQAENERLEKELETEKNQVIRLESQIGRLLSMNQAKLDTIHDLQEENNWYNETLNTTKAEAYKECIEKVEEIICDNTYPDFDINHKAVNIWKAEAYKNIDDLLKKLIGE